MDRPHQLASLVGKHRERVFTAEDFLWKHPETGYREIESSEYLENAFLALGYEVVKYKGLTGFYADVYTGRPGPTLALMAELDSLICETHPDADPATKAVHACGHCAQGAALLGVACALREEGALDGMCGRIRLMLVPAEELIEVGYRDGLRRDGKISYFGGKVEFLRRGAFDGVDMAMMIHTATMSGTIFGCSGGGNGCILKNVDYIGVAAHAGGSPHLGVNALYAANVGMTAVNALRETFRDEDHVRVHPIITCGGTAVNAIPELVTMESYVRGATMDAILGVSARVNRAIAASAAAMGARVVIHDRPGYAPLRNDPTMSEIAERAARGVVRDYIPFGGDPDSVLNFDADMWDTGCTDNGDISCVMPVLQPFCAGASGHGHGNDYKIADVEKACIAPGKLMIATAWELLSDGAAEAKRVIRNKKTLCRDKDDYFRRADAQFADRDAVVYNADGTVTLRYC